ncbi:unnamed protein product [Phytophthora fragariaefolia]|uniref:Unnamed protein product n=1 Tax=Phytophthora fragariaefolia TaxID=1490495 RepID=A0A9W6XT35_9STRA|nr:unnamed protein product [Phytophthora fragariaefolia]
MSSPSRLAGVGALGEQVAGADSAKSTSSSTTLDVAEIGLSGTEDWRSIMARAEVHVVRMELGTRSHQARQGSPTSMSTAASHQFALVGNHGKLAGGANGTDGSKYSSESNRGAGVLLAASNSVTALYNVPYNSVRTERRALNTSGSEVVPPAELEAWLEDADEVGADTSAVPEAGIVGSADFTDLPDLAVPLAVLVADLAALLDLAAGRSLLADLATGRGGLDDLAEELARAFLVEAGVTAGDGRFWSVDGAGETEAGVSGEAGFSSNASVTESDDSSLSTTDFLRSQ